jgi:hypothetical protein
LACYIKNIYIVRHAHFLKKIKGDFSGYEMGIGDAHYLKVNKATGNNSIFCQAFTKITVYNGEFPLI